MGKNHPFSSSLPYFSEAVAFSPKEEEEEEEQYYDKQPFPAPNQTAKSVTPNLKRALFCSGTVSVLLGFSEKNCPKSALKKITLLANPSGWECEKV